MNQAIKWVKDFSEKKIYEKKDIITLLSYDSSSLWWLVEPWINNDSPYFSSITDLLYLKFDKINKTSKIKNKIGCLLIPYLFSIKTNIRKIIIGHNPTNPCDVLIMTLPGFLQADKNVRIGSLINEFKKHCLINVLYYEDLASLGFKTRVQRKNNSYVNPIELFYDNNTKVIAKENRKKFINLFYRLKKEPAFISAFVINDKNSYNLLKGRIEFVFNRMVEEAIFYIEVTKNAIRKMKPKLIIQMSGSTLHGKAVIIAAHSLGVPVLEIQEGLIGETLYSIHSKKEVTRGCPLPDKIAVYGEYAKKQLLNYGGYDSKMIEIVGQPNTDALFKHANKRETLKKLEENKFSLGFSGKKVVLYATVADMPKETAIDTMKIVVSYFKNNDLFLFIKPHQRDQYVSDYKNIIKNMSNVIIKPDYNIYDAIQLSDIVVAFSNCTVILEALILNKIAIGLIPQEINNFIPFKPYIDSGAVLLVNNLNDLTTTIEQVSHNITLQKRLKEKRDLFITEQVYKIDGKVNERILNLALRMIKQKGENEAIKK